MKSALTILLLRMFAFLPLLVARKIGECSGSICWLLNTRMAQTTRTNLALCFPNLDQKARNTLAQKSLQHTFQTIFEAGAIWLWPAPKTLELVLAVEGLELLQNAKAAGKGVLVLAPHIGNWETLGLYLNTCGCGPTSQLYQALESKSLEAVIHKARSRSGARMVATNDKGIAELLRTLRKGEIVAILPDQVPIASGGEFAPFFSMPALTMTLLNKLQQKTGAEVVVACAIRDKQNNKNGFVIKFTAPEPGIYAEHMSDALVGMNRSIEKAATKHPEQYQWEYKRFKRQPEGVAKVY